MKIGTLIAIPLAMGAGIYLAFSYASGSLVGVFLSIAIYVFAAWIHYLAIEDMAK